MTGREIWMSWKVIDSWFELRCSVVQRGNPPASVGQGRIDLALQENQPDFKGFLTLQPRQIRLERLALGDHVAPGNLATSISGRAAENGGQV